MLDQPVLASSSFVWICLGFSVFSAARALLDEVQDERVASCHQHAAAAISICSGRIGTTGVTIMDLQLSQTGTGQTAAQDIVNQFEGREVLITGLVSASALSSDGAAKAGDLIVSRRAGQTQLDTLLERATDVLQREVGEDGRWLSAQRNTTGETEQETQVQKENVKCPRIHYHTVHANIDSGHSNMGYLTNMLIEGADSVLTDSSVRSILVLGVLDGKTPRVAYEASGRQDAEDLVAACIASYTRELIELSTTMQNLTNTVSSIQGTEQILLPPPPPSGDNSIPQFESHRYPIYGKAVLLVIPTANKMKVELLDSAIRHKVPDGLNLHTITVPSDSGVGEQPYNDAGILGCHNRISNALEALHDAKYDDILREKHIGTVLVGSIESYFETDDVAADRPTDYGLIIVHNAMAEKTAVCASRGTTVARAYVDRARRFGFEGGDTRFGRVTVGQVLAAHVPGLDKADWQLVLGGCSRYKLLKDAVERLDIPWDVG